MDFGHIIWVLRVYLSFLYIPGSFFFSSSYLLEVILTAEIACSWNWAFLSSDLGEMVATAATFVEHPDDE